MRNKMNLSLIIISLFGTLFGVFLVVRQFVFLSPYESYCLNNWCDMLLNPYPTSSVVGYIVLVVFGGTFVSSTIRFVLQRNPRKDSYNPDYMI